MKEMGVILLGAFIFIRGILWVKMGKTGVKTNYILGVISIVVGVLMVGSSIISFL